MSDAPPTNDLLTSDLLANDLLTSELLSKLTTTLNVEAGCISVAAPKVLKVDQQKVSFRAQLLELDLTSLV